MLPCMVVCMIVHMGRGGANANLRQGKAVNVMPPSASRLGRQDGLAVAGIAHASGG